MGDVYRKFNPDADISFTCASPVTGGQLVERVTGAVRTVQPAGAGSIRAVGVAKFDVPAARTSVQGVQVGDGLELTVMQGVIPVTYAASAAEGDRLIAAAGGQVTPAGATPDARTIVGTAFEAASAGQVKLAKIDPVGA